MGRGGFDEDEEKPLDPAAERLRRKMIRLLAVSIGTMLVAVMAVLGAVVYKVAGPRQPTAATAATLDLPAGASVEDMALSGGEALLRLRLREGERERLLRVDIATGRVLGTLDLRRP
ncbi:hypothetical protein [Aureimonas leprariae]|uniref:Fimbrial protein n=1 Tax=Plantimonas leprariae TaxID=2615207 RepID=A0A7V7PMD8_9HYPH|nr:hypothetical protein [Aureimonas leprariae]KAB0678036.1 hypothetical protein F6X38_16540 [Aureimonas leprariae]